MMTPERKQQIRDLLQGALQLDPAQRNDYLEHHFSSDSSLLKDVDSLLNTEHELHTSYLGSAANTRFDSGPSTVTSKSGSTIGPSMTAEEWERVRTILEFAMELQPKNRAEYLAESCPDPWLRRRVQSLILSHEQLNADFLTTATGADPFSGVERFRLPAKARVGAYEILEEIAIGGMGTVYRAVRADGQYKQQVALKIVRAELGAEFTASRFRNERQILASLDHTNIARILDAGTTPSGLPYFVMEFIDGVPITEYCDKHKLTVDARLKIFQAVCSAVHYAHQHLVIHRDIKPGNILVTLEGVPKLLDFGIAKILDASLLPEVATLTIGGLWLMTPEYASPEQFRGEPVTTATDVYSLGLMLYEMLTGHRAYQFPSLMPHDIARVVLEIDPERPSAAIWRKGTSKERSEEKGPLTAELVGALRGESPEKLCRRLGGDLDNIVMKALRKDPRERYSSTDQFSEDIRRHLERLPVVARESTVAYRFRKYIARNKLRVAVAAVVFVSLLTGMALTLREARIAQRRFNDIRTIANSLLFEIHDSIHDLPGSTPARKLILDRAQEYLDNLTRDSKNDPGLLRELAAAYERLASLQGDKNDANLGNISKAVQDWRRAIQLRKAALALQPRNPDIRRELALSYTNSSAIFKDAGDKKGAIESAHTGLLILEPLARANPDDARVQSALGAAYEGNAGLLLLDNEQDKARESYENSLRIYEGLLKREPGNDGYQKRVSFNHKHLGSLLAVQKRFDQALDHYRQALAFDEARLAVHPDNVSARYSITYSYSDIGYILGELGDVDAALSNYGRVLDIRAAMVLADPHDARARAGLGNTHNYIGGLLQKKGDYAAALDSFKKALSIRESLMKSDPANEQLRLSVAVTRMQIGGLYVTMATKAPAGIEKQITLCQQARTWLEQSLPVFRQMQAEGKLQGDELNGQTVINEELDHCDRLLASHRHPLKRR